MHSNNRQPLKNLVEYSIHPKIHHGYNLLHKDIAATDFLSSLPPTLLIDASQKYKYPLYHADRLYNPLNKNRLKEIGFDYVALGHIHKLDYNNEENPGDPDNGQKTSNYYKIPIRLGGADAHKINRNTIYKVKVTIDRLGQLKPDIPVELTPEYEVYPWEEVYIDVGSDDVKYLELREEEIIMKDITTSSEQYFTSSTPIESVSIDEVYYYDKYGDITRQKPKDRADIEGGYTKEFTDRGNSQQHAEGKAKRITKMTHEFESLKKNLR